ncbi:MAG TPA: DUF4394 domain-containing protein, partial [Pirellulales bacterium]|nr:DUF4394 domain-containing protein [Pirellulales bacterium]
FYDPLYLNTARPTISDNVIIHSASAAISANPNSFQASRFETDLPITVTAVPTQPNGQTFQLDGLTFEFESNGVYSQGNVPVPFQSTWTTQQVAASLAAAIDSSLFGSTVDRAQVIDNTVTLPGAHVAFGVTGPVTAPVALPTYVTDYQRFGPDVHGNTLSQGGAQNSINGLFIRINTQAGQVLDTLDVSAEFASTDIPYVLEENLVLHDNAGGNTQSSPQVTARLAGQLRIDPGVLVKLSGSRIEAGMGANLTAEGTPAQPIVFTSLNDTRYGGGGTFDTGGTGGTVQAQAGDWGGLYFWPTSSGSFDHTLITFGGGNTAIEGGFASFSAIEIHQAKVRIADSTLENNANGVGDFVGDRNGRAVNDASTIYVLGAQPVIVNNVIQNNQGAAISSDVDSLNSDQVPDWGRGTAPAGGYPILNSNLPAAFDAGSTGPLVERFSEFDDNHGPLVRLNKIGGNAINGMVIRGGTLETSSIWDDTDIVHVLQGSVIVPNFASVGGLRLQSSDTQSLVVKSLPGSGIIASGQPLDIADRIGGEVQVVGTPQHPVVMTSFKDDSVGAGLTPADQPDNDTNGDGANSKPAPGDWGTTDPNSVGSSGGLVFDQYSNDRNVAVVDELEPGLTGGKGVNETPATAQSLGLLAPNEQSGDDNSRLGFEVHGTISPDYTQDVDTYTFKATAGTQVWLNVTGTSPALDSVLELVDANGNVLARSDNAGAEQADAAANGDPLMPGPMLTNPALNGGLTNNLARPLQDGMFTQATGGQTQGMNFWSTNTHDPGFRVVLPGPAGVNNYYVRIYSKGPASAPYMPNTGSAGEVSHGLSGGQYQLQVRLQEQVEVPGSEVQYSDIRYATNGIDVEGLPAHSPLIANTTSISAGSQGGAQDLGNLLTSDTNSINVGGNLQTPQQVDWYKFELTYAEIQVIGPPSPKTWSTMFNVGYADGLTRANTEIDVYDSQGDLIYVGRDSNVADQQPRPNAGLDANELLHSSFGTLDPSIGPVTMETGTPKDPPGTFTYFVAIHSDAVLPTALDGTFNANSGNFLVRLEPADSINRVVEDHIGTEGGQTAESVANLTPLFGATDPTAASLGDFKSPTGTIAQLNSYAAPYNLSDVVLFVNTPGQNGHLETINPFSGKSETDQGQDTVGGTTGYGAIAMRNDGLLYGETTGTTDANSGQYTQIDTGTAAANVIGGDGIATYYLKPGNPPAVTAANVGVQINAMAFIQNGVGPGNANPHTDRQLYVVGSYTPNLPGAQPFLNGLYELYPDTGAVVPVNQGGINPTPNTAVPPTQPQPVLVTGLQGSETITGMAFDNDNGTMYIVGDAGNLYTLNYRSGVATFIANVGGLSLSFEGLSFGPPDVEGGKYKDLLFATAPGGLYAFDTSGVLAQENGHGIFSSDNGASYSTSVSLPPGVSGQIAFSTLDYNLWHVTQDRKSDPGHNINVAPDQSRNTQSPNKPPQNAGQSFYFGLDKPPSMDGDSENSQSQPDAKNYVTNPGDYKTYNTPGGAYGSLVTNSFSLANYAAADKPTVYFNYFLNTQDATSSKANLDTMLDSARLLISEDGGNTWHLLASNNTYRPNFPDPEAEQPYYQTANADTGSGDSGVGGLQVVQPLFDSTTTGTGWRQARIDLSDYAGQNNLTFRFDFSTAGTTFNPSDLSINAVNGAIDPYGNNTAYGNQFGNFTGGQTGPNAGAQRGEQNSHEGWYIDDIVVGFAERGEMVTSSTANTSYFNTPVDPNPNDFKEVLTGPYQLEIRRGEEFGVTPIKGKPDVALYQSFDTNYRFADGWSIVAPAGSGLTVGETFTLNDGTHEVTFQFVNNSTQLTNPSYVAVIFSPTDTAQTVADSIVGAINGNKTLVNVSAADEPNDTSLNGPQGVSEPSTNIVNLFNVVDLTASGAIAAAGGQLTVSLANKSVTESSTRNIGTVTRTNVNGPPTVNLTAIDVPTGNFSTNVYNYIGSVTFAPGATTATFTYDGVVDQTVVNGSSVEMADGTHTVEFLASAPGYSSVGATVDVTDDVSPPPGVLPQFTVLLNGFTGVSSALENSPSPASGTVVVNTGPVNAAQHPNGLTVNISSLWPAAALVSSAFAGPGAAQATVTIPVGATSVGFWVFPQDDNVSGRPGSARNAEIVATAAGVLSGNATLSVRDDSDGRIPYGVAQWSAMGPAPINGGFSNPGGDSGRITGVAPDPTNANVMYIAAAGGGVWKTTDATAASPTWTPLTDNLTDTSGNPIGLFMGAIAIAPSNHNVIYAGTGEANNSGDSGYGRGILVSTDGGVNWTLETGPSNAFNRLTVSRIAVDPVNPNIAYAAIGDLAENGLSGNTGIWKTTNFGVTWTNTTATAIGDTTDPYSDVVVDPNNSSTIYAAIGHPGGSASNGIYKSTDSGATWNLLSNFPNGANDGRISIAVSSRNNPNVLYADVSATGKNFGALYKIESSTDGGATWTDDTAAAADFTGGQGWYDLTMAVDPNNSKIAYAAGSTNFGGVGMIETTDGGATWQNITVGDDGNFPHTDWHAMAFSATDKLLVGSDGGIWSKEIDPNNPTGFIWVNRNGNLNTIQFESIALDPNDSTIALGGSQDNGTERYSGSPVWSETDGGDGGNVEFDPQNPSIAYRVSPVGSFGLADFFRVSNDNGQTWTSATNGLKVSAANINFYPPFAVAPSNGNEVILGDDNLWITTDGANSWTQLTTIGTAGWNPNKDAFGNPRNVDAIAIAPTDANTIYAATGGEFNPNSDIFVSIDGGKTWNMVDLPAGSGRVNQLAVDPGNSQIVYAVVNMFTGSSAGHVFRSINGGTSWTDISGNLPDQPTNAIAINSTTGAVYVGDDTQVFASTNVGSPTVSWAPLGVGLPYAQVVDLQYNPTFGLLAAATHGRGAWLVSPVTAGATLGVSVNGSEQVSDEAGVLVNKLTITRTGGTVGNLVVNLTSSNPAVATVPATVTIPNNQSSVNVSVTIVDPMLAVGPQSVIFSASAPSAGSAESIGALLDVVPDSQAAEPNTSGDNDTPALTLSIPNVMMIPGTPSETLTGTVTRNTPTTYPLKVTLASLNPAAASIVGPTTITIPAGVASATFTITAVDAFSTSATTLQGEIVAAANGYASATSPVSSQTVNAIVQYNPPVPAVEGDVTKPRPQGELIIYANQIADTQGSGILVENSAPGGVPGDNNGNLIHQGGLINTPTLNSAQLVDGVVIINNLIYGVGGSGIRFQGDPSASPAGAVPFGRIVNNTIYGGDSQAGIGIIVANRASPTILNNLLVNLSAGVLVDASSNAVLGENLFQN